LAARHQLVVLRIRSFEGERLTGRKNQPQCNDKPRHDMPPVKTALLISLPNLQRGSNTDRVPDGNENNRRVCRAAAMGAPAFSGSA
jgi:hypothetical protein